MRLTDTPAEDHQLLDLFVQKIRKQLEGEVISALKPTIDKAIDVAVAELNMNITSYYEIAKDQMVHRLVVDRRGGVR